MKKVKVLKSTSNTSAIVVAENKSLSAPTIVPKASKADIINAMVEVARKKHEKDLEDFKDKSEEIRKKLEAMCVDLLGGDIGNHEYSVDLPRFERDGVDFVIKFKCPKMQKVSNEYIKLRNSISTYFHETDFRFKLKNAMAGPSPVLAILANPENVDKIEKFLASMSK